MQDQNDTTQTQDAPEPQEVPQEQPQAEEQAPTQTEQPDVPEQVQEAQEEQVQEAPSYDAADVNTAEYLRQMQSSSPVQPDEDGYIDPNAFRQSVIEEVEQKWQFQQQEQKAWSALEEKYPELQKDPELKELVDAQRFADVAKGGEGNLSKIAEKVMGKMNTYKQVGKAQAQVSEEVQKSASLQTATSNKVETNKESDLIERMSRGDEAAQHELISDWLAQGKL